MSQVVKLKVEGMDTLLRVLRQLPEEMRSNVFVKAGHRAGQTMERSIMRNTPRSKKRRKPGPHYRDIITYAIREFKNAGSVAVVVGAESGKAPHSILVEFGTARRYTNSKTRYRRVKTGGFRTIIKNGKARVIKATEKRSIGSFQKKNKKPTYYRGIMPAFFPIKKGVAAIQAKVAADLKNDIKNFIGLEFTKAAYARRAR